MWTRMAAVAKGKTCPVCGLPMFAESENDKAAGREVVYVCRSHEPPFREKVFESYADG